ncbi:histidinol-phosphate transaminase [Candidatus Gracilibacteria bacterium]|nr:histidinol-phosphate transaminase [Candidatus Gracilibacteria bacterium]
MAEIAHLMRPEIADLEAYTPIVPLDVLAARLGLPIEQLIKLDANENPYGPAPQALAALAGEPHYAIYPDPESGQLRQRLAEYTGQPTARVVCGAGADELIDLLLRIFIAPGDMVIDCPPTFGMYAFDTGVCGGRVLTVPRRADFSLDLAGIEAAAERGAKLLFLTSPNNPTGNLTPLDEIERLLKLPLLVVVDEAYIEFAAHAGAPSVGAWVGRYANLAVLRTFSKWAGLAGLRVGYGLLPELVAEQVWKIKQPYNVNLAAQAAAIASLDNRAYLIQNVARIVAERERLFAALQTIDYLHPYPSQANFVLCRVLRGEAATIKNELARQGILVRYYRTSLLHDCLRISVGRPEQNAALLCALQEMVGGRVCCALYRKRYVERHSEAARFRSRTSLASWQNYAAPFSERRCRRP